MAILSFFCIVTTNNEEIQKTTNILLMMFTGNKSSNQFLVHMNVIMTNWKILIFVFLLYRCKTLQLEDVLG